MLERQAPLLNLTLAELMTVLVSFFVQDTKDHVMGFRDREVIALGFSASSLYKVITFTEVNSNRV